MERPRFDPRTALIVVDLQNDFADPAGSLHVPEGERIVGAINALVSEAGAAGAFLVYTQDWHPERTPHFENHGGRWPAHCVKETWGARLVDGLRVEGPVVRKGTAGEDGYSGFAMRDPETGRETNTELDRMLKAWGVARVVVVGLAEDICVKATALDAARLGYETFVIRSATRPVSAEGVEEARAEMRGAGIVLVD